MGDPKTICVIGLWHLGSVVAACWADLGHRVIGCDRAANVVAQLGSGRAPVFEPELEPPAAFEMVDDAYEAARGASALVILTEWPEFLSLDFDRIKSIMAAPVIIDGKNLLTQLRLGDRGFHYSEIGRWHSR